MGPRHVSIVVRLADEHELRVAFETVNDKNKDPHHDHQLRTAFRTIRQTTLRTLNYGNLVFFVIMGNAGLYHQLYGPAARASARCCFRGACASGESMGPHHEHQLLVTFRGPPAS